MSSRWGEIRLIDDMEPVFFLCSGVRNIAYTVLEPKEMLDIPHKKHRDWDSENIEGNCLATWQSTQSGPGWQMEVSGREHRCIPR